LRIDFCQKLGALKAIPP